MTQVLNISNNPDNPKIGNAGDVRELDVMVCEFFENGDYKQILIAGMLTTKDLDGNVTGTGICKGNSRDGSFEYNTFKETAIGTCTFNKINNVVKANACPNITASLVAQFDAQKLFD